MIKISKIGILAVTSIFLLSSTITTVKAETIIETNINTKVLSGDSQTNINENGELVFDDNKKDVPYYLGYSAELDMKNVWSSYSSSRQLYILSQRLKGMSLDEATKKWNRLELIGHWDFSFKVDQSIQKVNETLLTPEGFTEVINQMNDSRFTQFFKVESVKYDELTGEVNVRYIISNNGVNRLKTEDLESSLPISEFPKTLIFATPEKSVRLESSDFIVGEDLVVSDISISGQLDVSPLFIQQLPFKFNGLGEDLIVKMVTNQDPVNSISIIDNYENSEDRILKIFRTDKTNEKNVSLLDTGKLQDDFTYPVTGTYSYMYDLRLKINGRDILEDEINHLEWSVKPVGGFENENYIEIENGSKVVKALNSGVVELTVEYKGKTDSIFILIPGDLSRDNLVDNIDAGLVYDIYFETGNSNISKDDFTDLLADMNGDLIIDSTDAGIIMDMYYGSVLPSN